MPPRVSRENRVRIVALSKSGKSVRAIAAEVGCAVSTVVRVIHAFRDEGRIRDAARSARPRATSELEDLMIIAAVVDEPFLSAGEIIRELGIPASEHAIRLRLHEAGLSCINGNTRRSLTAEVRDVRLNFASEYSSWTVSQWQRVVFTNESTICCKWDKSKHSWRPLQNWNDPIYVRQLGASGHLFINVWTAVTYQGVGPIHRVKQGSLSPDDYVDIVDQVLMPFLLSGPFRDGNFLLQQDATPTYSSSRVRRHLEARGIVQMPWPPKFEDLNPIRNAWVLLKARLWRRRLDDRSPDNLWALIKKEWDKLVDMPNLMSTFYASLPDKMREVVANKGSLLTTSEPFTNGQPRTSQSCQNKKEQKDLPLEDELENASSDSTVSE